MDSYTLISYRLTKYCSFQNSYILLDFNIADADKVMSNYKLSIVGTLDKGTSLAKMDHLDSLLKVLLTKLTSAMGGNIAFDYSKAKNRAYLSFGQEGKHQYILLTI